MCGLKHALVDILKRLVKVTPFVGVWIETHMYPFGYAIRVSHPSWVCGLKQKANMDYTENIKRHTLRGCVD